jgi:hypothetical protein
MTGNDMAILVFFMSTLIHWPSWPTISTEAQAAVSRLLAINADPARDSREHAPAADS